MMKKNDIDSPGPRAIEAALFGHKGTRMIKSTFLEKDRYEKLMPLIGKDLKLIALRVSDARVFQTVGDRMMMADGLLEGLVKTNVPMENIFVNPLVQPVSMGTGFGLDPKEMMRQMLLGIRKDFFSMTFLRHDERSCSDSMRI